MQTGHDPLDTRNHLLVLASDLTAADSEEPADPGRVSGIAWQLFAELSAVEFELAATRGRLQLVYTVARAAVADAGRRSRDPLIHLRHLLAAEGAMPPPGMAATTILAWEGQQLPRPRPAGRKRRAGPRQRLRCRVRRTAVR
jgi:hypothetical protein